jgi:hypothetical protein
MKRQEMSMLTISVVLVIFASSRRYGIKMSERHSSKLELFLGRFCIGGSNRMNDDRRHHGAMLAAYRYFY